MIISFLFTTRCHEPNIDPKQKQNFVTRIFGFSNTALNNNMCDPGRAYSWFEKKLFSVMGAYSGGSYHRKRSENENKNMCDPGRAYFHFLGQTAAGHAYFCFLGRMCPVTRIFVFSGGRGWSRVFLFSFGQRGRSRVFLFSRTNVPGHAYFCFLGRAGLVTCTVLVFSGQGGEARGGRGQGARERGTWQRVEM